MPKIRQFSEKQKEKDIELKAIKEQIRQEAKNTGQYYCVGCGLSNVKLDCSHIIPIKQREDLRLIKSNISLLCHFCHCKHESHIIEQRLELNCFIDDMHFIFENDSERFNKLLFKLLDYYEKHPHKDVAKLLKKIENFTEVDVF